MSSTKIALRQSQKSARRKSTMSVEVSPDSKCPICLDVFNNISYLDLCLHKFCFRCIHEWSKNKAECPLCKQPFNSIYHSIKSEQDFQKYDLRPSENGSFGSFGGARFRYRTTLTGVRREAQRRTSPPPDNGILFEGSANPPQQRQQCGLRRMMMRLAARRKAASEGRTMRNIEDQEMVRFRRDLYRRGVRVQSVRDGGRSRDTTAEFYRRNPACLHRLVPWLKRELMVLYGAHGSLVNIVQHIIMSRITRYDMEDGAIQEELRPFLQRRTDHFLHEFINFAKSPFNMEAYDQHAVYDCPAPSSNEGSSSNSSIINISEDEHSVELDPPGDSMLTLSQSVWDDETPGPSYSITAEHSKDQRLLVPDSDSDSSVEEETQGYGASPPHRSPHNQTDTPQSGVKKDECLSSDNEDCVIIGFVKPRTERTPELVQLSSNSDGSDHEDTKDVPRLPQHIRFTSLSPPASQSRGPGSSERSDSIQREDYQLASKSIPTKNESSSKPERKDIDHRDRESRRFPSDDRSRERQRSRSRDRRRRRSKSGEHRHSSRSPAISLNSGSTLSRGTRHSRSSNRDRAFSKWASKDKKRDSGSSRNALSHSYHSESYSHYSQERDVSGVHYTERRSYYFSCRRNSDRRSCSRSRSRSKESHRRDRRHSRSRTHSSSPSTRRRSHRDKPGGKRKYKTRHLEEPAKNALSKTTCPEPVSSMSLTKVKKKRKEKHHKRSKEKMRKRSKSLSVEIVCEGSSPDRSRRHHKKKKKHKKKSKRHKSRERTEKHSPTVITIDSDSDYVANDNPINDGTDAPADSAALCKQVFTGGVSKEGSKVASSPAANANVELNNGPDVEGKQSLKDTVNTHTPLNADTSTSFCDSS